MCFFVTNPAHQYIKATKPTASTSRPSARALARWARPRRVDQADGAALPFPVYRNGIARDPGLRAGDQPLLPQKLVDEGGLACIRPADDGEFQRTVRAVFPLDVFSRFALARLATGIDIGGQRIVTIAHALPIHTPKRQPNVHA